MTSMRQIDLVRIALGYKPFKLIESTPKTRLFVSPSGDPLRTADNLYVFTSATAQGVAITQFRGNEYRMNCYSVDKKGNIHVSDLNDDVSISRIEIKPDNYDQIKICYGITQDVGFGIRESGSNKWISVPVTLRELAQKHMQLEGIQDVNLDESMENRLAQMYKRDVTCGDDLSWDISEEVDKHFDAAAHHAAITIPAIYRAVHDVVAILDEHKLPYITPEQRDFQLRKVLNDLDAHGIKYRIDKN